MIKNPMDSPFWYVAAPRADTTFLLTTLKKTLLENDHVLPILCVKRTTFCKISYIYDNIKLCLKKCQGIPSFRP